MFIKRALSIRFALAGDSADVLDLNGYRAEAVIDNPGGVLAMGTLHLRIWGMSLPDMSRLSTNGLHALAVRMDRVTVSAGDDGGAVHQVFDGTIAAGYADFNGAPETSFNIRAQAGLLMAAKPTTPATFKGSADVASIIKGMAAQAGFAFRNSGVTAQLSNPYFPGSLRDQMMAVARAANIMIAIENGVVSIWPNGSARDDTTVSVGPDSGMVGYPEFTTSGIQVRKVFDPGFAIGRKCTVSSLIPRANGTWFVQTMRHELSTLQPGGPWFTTAKLTYEGFFLAR
ncbi:MAG: hypothetical protein KGH75_06495 [Rhodospirillales bacterium]|nr:hypothetical protein [Rhodospirillales bacterium]